jgi:hypothetical protein
MPALRGAALADFGAVFRLAVVRTFAAGFFFAPAFAFDFAADARFPDERAAFARAGFALAMRAG